ncbi:type III secretion system chaperone [uncultured Aureimonas sp.]|uniref:type III secretion system chaperone n=1 Tax=uncultured Aureimonas sp. TaxID=1604662 RepID=UPI0025F3F886|nr:type III secretion system chaperone [uncultured Aureimonas sp.]
MAHVDISPLMEAIGPLDDDILAVTAIGETWVVRLEDLDIQVEEDRAAQRHLLTAVVAGPPSAGRLEVYETLLQYNLLRRETGMCSALGPDGEVVLLAEVPSEGMNVPLLLDVLQNIAAKARAFAPLVAQAPAPAQAGDLDLGMIAIRI